MGDLTIHSLTIVRNEAHRYLEAMLIHTKKYVDDMFMFDDGSTDNSAEIGVQHCMAVYGTGTSNFLVDEGSLRSTALSNLAELTAIDWVLSIDADEFINVGEGTLYDICTEAETLGKNCVQFFIPEIFDPYPPKARVDGFWASIFGPRLFKFDGTVDYKKGLGCGSVPLSVSKDSTMSVGADRACILHYGYAHPADREEKYRRYVGRREHNSKHVESIMSTPLLVDVDLKGGGPDVWRGVSI
jgi:hypothetical protein